jgi:hypothetical protein
VRFGDAGVIDQQVDAPELTQGGVEERRDLALVAHVTRLDDD